MPKIRLLDDRVLIMPEELEKTSSGGIVLPNVVDRDEPMVGEIVSVGPGKSNPLKVKVGDTVLYNKYAGTLVKFDDEEKKYLIMREEDLLAILE